MQRRSQKCSEVTDISLQDISYACSMQQIRSTEKQALSKLRIDQVGETS